MACQMPLKLGLPSDVRADPDAGTALERVTAIPIPAPTAAERMTITIVEPLIRLLMVNLPEQSISHPRLMIPRCRLMRCRHDNPRRINFKLTNDRCFLLSCCKFFSEKADHAC